MSWLIFASIIIILSMLDIRTFQQKNEPTSLQKSLYYSIFYFSVSCIFGIYIFYTHGQTKASEYFACFLIEKSMSLDNIFVMSVIFQFFSIPMAHQHKILFLGIVSVLVFRAIMIYYGSIILNQYSYVLYFLGVILIIFGIKTCFTNNRNFSIANSLIYRTLQKYCNISDEIDSSTFFIKKNSKIYVTRLFLALIMIEAMDLAFALDSIPASFAITNDVYIIYTSNIFAILGLRSLFFCLSHIIERFKYIKYAISIILIFIGSKILLEHYVTISNHISLMTIVALLIIAIISSALTAKRT